MKEKPNSWWALAAAVTAMLLVALRLAVDHSLGGWSAEQSVHLFACIGVGSLLAWVLGHAMWTAATASRSQSPEAVVSSPAIWWLWIGILLLAILVLPAAFRVNEFPLASLLVFGSLVAFPAAYVDGRQLTHPSPSPSRLVEPGYRALPYLLMLVALISSTCYVARAWQSIGGVDFFYYLCGARDMLTQGSAVSADCYAYFPGVYAFWRTVMTWVGDTLPQLQFCYMLVLLVNALLLAWIVVRHTGSLLASSFAGIWYLVLVSRFQGLTGVTEPIATAVLLLGCLIWNGQSLRGRRGFLVSLFLGMSLGLTVYTKQQAGLLTLGATSLLLLRPAMSDARKHGWAQLALLPITAFTTLLVAVSLEGRGWTPLVKGLSFASAYGSESSFLRSLYTQIRGDESAAVAAGLMVLAWLGMYLRRRQWADHQLYQLASFALFAFLFSFVQFLSRPFGHYMLLGIPWLVLGATLLAHTRLAQLPDRWAGSLLVRTLLLAAVAVLFFNTAGRTNTLCAWRLRLPDDFTANPLWHQQPAQAADIAAARLVVAPDSTMYVLPPRHNSVYFLLQTRTINPHGYAFRDANLDELPWSECRYCILLTRGLEEDDQQHDTADRMQSARALLATHGFQRSHAPQLKTVELETVELESMELYERPVEPEKQVQR